MARFEISAERFDELLRLPSGQAEETVTLMERVARASGALEDFERYFSLFKLNELSGFAAAEAIAARLYADDLVRADQLLDGDAPTRAEVLTYARMIFEETGEFPFGLGMTVWGHEFACGGRSLFLLFDLTDIQYLDLADMFLGKFASLAEARDALIEVGVEI